MPIAQRKPVFNVTGHMDWEETQPKRHEGGQTRVRPRFQKAQSA